MKRGRDIVLELAAAAEELEKIGQGPTA